MSHEATTHLCILLRIGGDQAPYAPDNEVRHVRTKTRHVSKASHGLTIDTCKHRLTRVFNNLQVVPACDVRYRSHVARETEKMHWNYGFSPRGDMTLYLPRIDVERARINIHEHGRQIILQHHI